MSLGLGWRWGGHECLYKSSPPNSFTNVNPMGIPHGERKSQMITKCIRIHHLRTENVCLYADRNPSNSYVDI